MNRELLAEADRIVESLSPGKRESVREIVIDAIHRGFLPESGRRYLQGATGSDLLGDVLAEGISEMRDRQTITERGDRSGVPDTYMPGTP